MNLPRGLRHLLTPHWVARRAFPGAVCAAIEAAVKAAEMGHRGEVRFVVEGPLGPSALRRFASNRARALALFAELGVWDTAENTGVLVYVNVVDGEVELVADRGIDLKVGQEIWRAIVAEMETAFRAGQFERGAVVALGRIGEQLRAHYPLHGPNPDELPDAPLVL